MFCDGITATDITRISPGYSLPGTGNTFRRDHRIRVEISSSNFPRFDRNPNTGHPFGKDAETRLAHQTIYHSRENASRILLPVIL